MDRTLSKRSIRSYVLRAGRMTPSQEKALDEIWPAYGLDYSPSTLDLDSIFGRCADRIVEIGFGNGEALLEGAIGNPQADYLGIEVHRPGIGRLLLGVRDAGADNVRVICHDAVEVLQHQIGDCTLDEVRLFFPDPWPKKKHHKRRIVTPGFARLVASKLKQGGRFHGATDWQGYAWHMLEVLEACPFFENAAGSGFSERPASRSRTKFERRGQRLGHGVWDLIYLRCA